MNTIKIIHQLLISILLFTLWAGFALLIINPMYRSDFPRYIIGRLCIWDYGAIVIAVLFSFIFTKYLGYPEIKVVEKNKKLVFNIFYAYFFLGYFVLGLAIAIWQFWLFSQKF
jgi:hypothetical protein